MEIYAIKTKGEIPKLLLIPELYKQINNYVKRTGIIYSKVNSVYIKTLYVGDEIISYLRITQQNAKEYTKELNNLKKLLIEDSVLDSIFNEIMVWIFSEEIINEINHLLSGGNQKC